MPADIKTSQMVTLLRPDLDIKTKEMFLRLGLMSGGVNLTYKHV